MASFSDSGVHGVTKTSSPDVLGLKGQIGGIQQRQGIIEFQSLQIEISARAVVVGSSATLGDELAGSRTAAPARLSAQSKHVEVIDDDD